MNKEMLSMVEALDELLEKFELIEAKRRQEEKIDKLLEMFELREKRERESMLEISAIIRATTAVFKSPSSPSTPASPLVPARCSTECLNNNITWVDANSSHNGEMPAPMVALELGESKDKDPATYIVTKDLPMVTPTRCSLICSSSDVKPDLIVNVVLACALL